MLPRAVGREGASSDPFFFQWLDDWFERYREYNLVARLEKLEKKLASFLRSFNPDLVILPEETDYARGLLASLVLANFPKIRRGVLFPLYYQLFASYPVSLRPAAHHYVVFAESLRRALDRTVPPGTRVQHLGIPCDTQPAYLPPKKKQLIYLLQGIQFEARIVKDVLNAAAKTGFEVTLKLHPRDPESSRKVCELACRESFVNIAPPNQSLRKLAAECTAVLGQSSTGFFESLALQRPLLVAHYQPGPFPLRLVPDGNWVQVFSHLQELVGQLHQLGQHPLPDPPIYGMDPALYAKAIWQDWEMLLSPAKHGGSQAKYLAKNQIHTRDVPTR